MNGLVCTCRPGESVTGTRQEIIEQQLAPNFGLSIPEVHALLDLMTDTLDIVLDLPEESRGEDETARRMAEQSGRTVGWMKDFLTAWEFEAGELERTMHVPWNGLRFGRRGEDG
jgi:hypothetical protein